ncbi:MAG: hypothetical protein K2X38_13155 [Gemmataceae bacterium]|nr:hypothetical protein [Gemmataceae bacterium]
MVSQGRDLWALVQGQPAIEPMDLLAAIEDQIRRNDLDFRSRLLIRDSINALRARLGPQYLNEWLMSSATRDDIQRICEEELGRVGFPFLGKQLMQTTTPETIRQMLREIGLTIPRRTEMFVAGSVALILPEYIARATTDIDCIDEVPEEIRSRHDWLHRLEDRYSLKLGHVQQHYFPSGWKERVHGMEPFGRLSVYLLDVYDIFMSKLFSSREKDLDDLRQLVPQLTKETIERRLKENSGGFLAAPRLKELAERNWQILFGEALPQ